MIGAGIRPLRIRSVPFPQRESIAAHVIPSFIYPFAGAGLRLVLTKPMFSVKKYDFCVNRALVVCSIAHIDIDKKHSLISNISICYFITPCIILDIGKNTAFCGVNEIKKTVVFLWIAGLLFLMCGCGSRQAPQPGASIAAIGNSEQSALQETISGPEKMPKAEENKPMKIQVQAGEHVIVYALNNSRAAKELYAQLPLRTTVENFSTNEKVFYRRKNFPSPARRS